MSMDNSIPSQNKNARTIDASNAPSKPHSSFVGSRFSYQAEVPSLKSAGKSGMTIFPFTASAKGPACKGPIMEFWSSGRFRGIIGVDQAVQQGVPDARAAVAIARAILDKPDWLLLDKATPALDEELEAEIYRILSEVLPNTTIVSIGHRSTLIALHGRHIEMEPGQGGIFEPTPAIGARSSAGTSYGF